MIVVDKTNQNRTVNLKDFYEIKGLTRSNFLFFDWKKDHGIINGTKDQVKRINDIFNKTENFAFANFTILRKWDYDFEKCTTPFEKPCPYYQAALTSLMMPTSLALLTFFFISCCACCCSYLSCCSCCLIKGMYTGLSKLVSLNWGVNLPIFSI